MNTKKGRLILCVVLGLSGLSLATERSEKPPVARPSKPNVVLLLADDLGWQDLKCYDIGEPSPYESPNIDAFARRGVLFREAYSPAPTCSPSRCAILAGKHPARLQKTHVVGGAPPVPGGPYDRIITPWYSGRLRVEETTIAEALQKNGYRTGHSGKWHIAIDHYAYPQPEDHGFDVTFHGRGANTKMSPHRLTGFATNADDDPYRLDAKGFPRDEVTLNAMAFMEESKHEPFFLYYAAWLVHYPIQTRSKALLEKYCDKLGVEFPQDPEGWPLDGQRNPYYCAMVEMLDAYVGRLIDYLETTDDPRWPGHKLIENTYVIFSSDNGGCEGGPKETYTDNYPLDKGKSSAKEGGVRVPMIFVGPGIKKGVDSHVLVNGIDFYPTILSWTKTPTPDGVELDGCDLSTLLKNQPTDATLVKDRSGAVRNIMIHHFPHGSSAQSTLRSGGCKLIYNYDHIGNDEDSRRPPLPELELYRLYDGTSRIDIEEARNLVSTQPERVQAMKAKLFTELDAMGASRPYLNPKARLWVPNKENVCTPLKAQRDGHTVSLSFKENGARVIKGYLMVTDNGGEKSEEWFRKKAVVTADGTLSAELPEGTTHYLFTLIDENNFLVTYPELDDMGAVRKKKKPFSSYAIGVK